MEPVASVVIPTIGRPILLRCLKALFRQSIDCKSFEIIVVSDGPGNPTKKLINLNDYKTQVRYFSLPERRGPAAARNLGWKKARAKIIGFTDDDTIPDKNWLKIALKEFKKGARVLSGKVIVPIPPKPTHYEKIIAYMENAEFLTANCFCLKSALIKVNGFDERFDIAWREDSDLQFKFIENNIPVKKLDNLKVTHPVRKAAWGDFLKEEKKNKYDALLFKKHPRLFRERIPRYRGLLILYYVITVTLIIAVLVSSQTFFLISSLLLTFLIIKRIRGTSYSLKTLVEVVFSSFFIPILSVFWRLYGAVKYRVIFF